MLHAIPNTNYPFSIQPNIPFSRGIANGVCGVSPNISKQQLYDDIRKCGMFRLDLLQELYPMLNIQFKRYLYYDNDRSSHSEILSTTGQVDMNRYHITARFKHKILIPSPRPPYLKYQISPRGPKEICIKSF